MHGMSTRPAPRPHYPTTIWQVRHAPGLLEEPLPRLDAVRWPRHVSNLVGSVNGNARLSFFVAQELNTDHGKSKMETE